MKKVLIVCVTVAVLVVLVVILNKEIPQATAPAAQTAGAASNSPDTSIAVGDLVFKDLDGKEVKLSDLRGKVVLLDFWATWCEPCKVETPWLIDFQKKYSSRGFTIIGVDIDSEIKKQGLVAHYVQTARFDVNGEKQGINYPVVLGDESLGDKFGLDGFPTGVLIARDGHLVKIMQGLPLGKDVLMKEIESQF